MSVRVFYEILNQRGTPAMFTDTLANRPTFGFAGRLFVSTDSGQIFEDTGTAWTLVADAGVGGGTLSSVCLNGNTTATGIVITAGGLSTNSLTNTSLTTGSILFADSGGLISQSNATFFWDNTNKRLGIGTASPSGPLDIHATGTNAYFNGTGSNNAYLQLQNAGVSKWRIGNTYNAGANSFDIYNNGLTTNAISINSTNNNITLTGNVTASTYYSSAGIFLSTGGQASAGGGYATINGGTNYLDFRPANGGIFLFSFPYNTTRTFTLPDTTGTIALTSDLSSYLPLTGGTLTGALNLTYASPNLQFNASTGGSNVLNFLVNSSVVGNLTINSSFYQLTNYSSGGWLFKNSIGNNVFTIADNGAAFLSSTLSINGGTITSAGSFSYTLPSSSGTLALTSQLSSYLPLTGGTLTGTLFMNGTGSNNAYIEFQNASTSKWKIGNTYNAGANNYEIYNSSTASTTLSINGTTNKATFNNGIITTGTADQQLWVYGTAPSLRLYSDLTATPSIIGFVGMASVPNNFIQTSVSGDMCIGTNTTGRLLLGTGTTTVNPLIAILPSTNVLIGITTDTGQKLQVNGTVRNLAINTNKSVVSVPTATPTTLYTFTTYGIYIFYSDLINGVGVPTLYSAYAIICYDGAVARILQQTNGGAYTLTLSGNSIQATQTSGITQNVNYVFQLIST